MLEVENRVLLQSWEETERIKENDMKTKGWNGMVVGKGLFLPGQLLYLGALGPTGLHNCGAANRLICLLFSFSMYQFWAFTRK